MAMPMNGETVENEIRFLQNETVSKIDLCAMQGISKDGYYKIVRSCSIVPWFYNSTCYSDRKTFLYNWSIGYIFDSIVIVKLL